MNMYMSLTLSVCMSISESIIMSIHFMLIVQVSNGSVPNICESHDWVY